MDVARRDALVAHFRRRVMARVGVLPFPSQAEWQLATEGWTLSLEPPREGDYYQDVLCVKAMAPVGALVLPQSDRIVNNIPVVTVRRKIEPRVGGAAHVCAALEAYKAGKSYWTAMWTSGFACLPDAKVHIIGLEYATAEPEFNYLADFLLSENGMNMRTSKFYNDARGGRMLIHLRTGAKFEVKSWERKESLKGKKITAYVYAEAYQLPGLSVYTSLSQNLREQRGFALFPTTPDSPWVGVFHDQGHGADPYWHCTCSVDARENPFTYDQAARDRDDPEKGGLMTREKYAISWCGSLGTYVGHVYAFLRADQARYFTPESHPALFKHTDASAVWAGMA